MLLTVKRGQQITRETVLGRLVDMLYERNDMAFVAGKFRVRGDVVEVHPATVGRGSDPHGIFRRRGGCASRASIRSPGTPTSRSGMMHFFPGQAVRHPGGQTEARPRHHPRRSSTTRHPVLESQGNLLEAQRLKMRTEYDLEMMQEMGFCNGIENYSRHLTGRPPGSKPFTLLDFFPRDFLLVIDESHATIPQIGGMYEGDKSRKTVLVEYGFRLPERARQPPARFPEFMDNDQPARLRQRHPGRVRDQEQHRRQQGLHSRTSATASGWKKTVPFVLPGHRAEARSAAPTSRRKSSTSTRRACRSSIEQIIRPTGLLDPKITLRPLKEPDRRHDRALPAAGGKARSASSSPP